MIQITSKLINKHDTERNYIENNNQTRCLLLCVAITALFQIARVQHAFKPTNISVLEETS